MTHKDKDAEIARLRRELDAERAAHTETRQMLGDALKMPVTMPAICPLPHVQPQIVPQLWPVVCEDCQRSTSGRCGMHPFTFFPISSVTS